MTDHNQFIKQKLPTTSALYFFSTENHCFWPVVLDQTKYKISNFVSITGAGDGFLNALIGSEFVEALMIDKNPNSRLWVEQKISTLLSSSGPVDFYKNLLLKTRNFTFHQHSQISFEKARENNLYLQSQESFEVVKKRLINCEVRFLDGCITKNLDQLDYTKKQETILYLSNLNDYLNVQDAQEILKFAPKLLVSYCYRPQKEQSERFFEVFSQQLKFHKIFLVGSWWDRCAVEEVRVWG